jgi:hypothetical protein
MQWSGGLVVVMDYTILGERTVQLEWVDLDLDRTRIGTLTFRTKFAQQSYKNIYNSTPGITTFIHCPLSSSSSSSSRVGFEFGWIS